MRVAGPLQKACVANVNAAAFTAKTAAQLTVPSGNAVNQIAAVDGGGGRLPNRIRIYPYGLGANNDAFALRLWSWYRGHNPDTWYSSILTQINCTMSAYTGVAGGQVLNTEAFADTISLVALIGEPTYTADVTRFGRVELYTPANDTPAWVELPLREPELLEWDFDQTTNTPTMNALYQLISEVD
jgi:hypothetical protein